MIKNDQHIKSKTLLAPTKSANEITGLRTEYQTCQSCKWIPQREPIHSLSEQVCPMENLKT